MRLKVISTIVDYCRSTVVVDADTGAKLDGVVSVEWSHLGPDDLTRMRIEIIDADADIETGPLPDAIADATTLSDIAKVFRRA